MEAAYDEFAELALFTLHEGVRRACLSHLRCEITTIAKTSLFLLVFALTMFLADDAPGVASKLTYAPLAHAMRPAVPQVIDR